MPLQRIPGAMVSDSSLTTASGVPTFDGGYASISWE